MIVYAKIIDEQTKEVSIGTGTDADYYESIGMTKMEVEHCDWNGAWYVAGYVPPQPEPTHDEQIAELKRKLADVDSKSTRSIRAILAGTATDEDRTYLSTLESQAAALREELRELEG